MKQVNIEREYNFEDADVNPDGMLNTIAEDNIFFNKSYARISKHREEHLKSLAQQIVKSFQGRVSKQRTMVPSKRLISKALTMDNYDKIYQNKKGNNGKHLNVNLIIDMSGSMNGEPVKNAIEMVYIFNEIAIAGKLNGCVIWSESSSRCKSTFPMPREFVKYMSSTGNSEGLGKNLNYYIKELKSSDVNICMTDGELTDDKILKSFYEKQNIDIIGVYVNEEAEDLTDYTGSLDRWFSRSLVRRTTDELCQKLIQLGLRKK